MVVALVKIEIAEILIFREIHENFICFFWIECSIMVRHFLKLLRVQLGRARVVSIVEAWAVVGAHVFVEHGA